MFEFCPTELYNYDDRKESVFEGMTDANEVWRYEENIDGSINTTYSNRFVELINRVILLDNFYLASVEQQRYLERYFKEADGILSDEMVIFDEFLGNYTGE